MLRRCKVNTKELSRRTGISELLLSILSNRGITAEKEIKDFMNPTLNKLHDPILMKDMDVGTDIICRAIKKNDRIVIYGDYDADGITSTFILYSALSRCGADVKYHIPDRVKEGYGININSIEKLNSEGYNTIVTCDNGISAVDEIKRAKELGMTVVVTDHHDIPFLSKDENDRTFILPSADAIINPKQKECKYPFKMLCGAGVAFKFAQVLYRKMGIDETEAYKFIEYAAIGTICDIVDLVGENRIIAKIGIELLNKSKNPGIRALIEENSLKMGNITAYHIGFVIGPCINAAGRLESAVLALKLFMAQDAETAAALAKKLKNLNIERQDMTSQSLEKIIDKIEKSQLKKDKVLVVYEEDVHESIAGIVAGRLKERYNLPSIVLTGGETMAKGSGRSIEEYNMYEELTKCGSLMENFGGHKMAAGMSIREENIEKLRKQLNTNCNLSENDLIPKIRIDRRLPLESINFKIINDIKSLEPFGKGNSTPIFAEKNIEIFRIYFMGKDKNILKLFCRLRSSMEKMDAISFDGGEKFKQIINKNYGSNELNKILTNNFRHIFMDFIFSPSINNYNGNTSIQLIIKDFRLSK